MWTLLALINANGHIRIGEMKRFRKAALTGGIRQGEVPFSSTVSQSDAKKEGIDAEAIPRGVIRNQPKRRSFLPPRFDFYPNRLVRD